jgi:hypothetical protein
MLAEKIKTMQLHEHHSEQMFNELMNLERIIVKEQLRHDLRMFYRNRVSRVTVYQTDLIPSENRLAIYNAFVEYAIDHDLFRFCAREEEGEHPREYLEDPMTIYTSEALVVIYNLYVSEDGNFQAIQKRIRREGRYKTAKYEGEQLRHNVKNLHLIGLYRMYKTAMRRSLHPCNGWQTFSCKYLPHLDKLAIEWLKVLFRIAVYDDAKNEEVTEISKLIKKNFVHYRNKSAEKKKAKLEK